MIIFKHEMLAVFRYTVGSDSLIPVKRSGMPLQIDNTAHCALHNTHSYTAHHTLPIILHIIHCLVTKDAHTAQSFQLTVQPVWEIGAVGLAGSAGGGQ